MNKRKAHKILSWLLLLFFSAGQVMVYAHQHCENAGNLTLQHHHNDQQKTIHEKCIFCDQMHHAPISYVQQPDFGLLFIPVINVYSALKHQYKGKSLVHADGLSPPASV